jgi:Rad3-related DNA helicase
MIPGLSPADVGFLPKFKSWRPGQLKAIDRGLQSDKRFIAHSMPVGEGKSGYYILHALLASKRACVLTSSKALETQAIDDFSCVGLVDMRGRNNYHCVVSECGSCEEGQYFKCDPNECEYEQARTRMLNAPLVVSNYQYYMLSNRYGRGMGDFDMLILDEAHAAPDEVCSAASLDISYAEANKAGTRLPREGAEMPAWWEWAKQVAVVCIERLKDLKAEIDEIKQARGRVHPTTAKDLKFWTQMNEKCQAILASAIKKQGEDNPPRWCVSRSNQGYHLEPVWASHYAEDLLYRKIPKVILVSATMVPKTMALLGIPKPEADYYEYPSSFPPKSSPVYFFGAARIDHKTDPSQLSIWLSRIDNIIRRRLDRKGIIHCVSYDRGKYIVQNSELSEYMIFPTSGKETQACVDDFNSSEAPVYLVSPAITTGLDFPYCVDEKARVLTANLEWVEAGSIEIGDKLVGFDEDPTGPEGKTQRCYREATVTDVNIINAPRYKMLIRNEKPTYQGDAYETTIIASADHKWLVFGTGSPTWVTTENLRFGKSYNSRLLRIIDTWETGSDRDTGYLAGAFDGEGHLSLYPSKRSNAVALGMAQKDNAMFAEVKAALERKGFYYCVYDKHSGNDVYGLQVTRRRDVFRFLGQIRPHRLLHKADINKFGSIRSGVLAKVITKIKLTDGPVVAITTDTGTLVVEGFASHNSRCEVNIIAKVPFLDARDPIIAARQEEDKDYGAYVTAQTIVQAHGRSMRAADDRSETFVLDSHFNWFFYRFRHLFPSWFHRLVTAPRGMPEPPAPLNRDAVLLPAPAEDESLSLSASQLSNLVEFPVSKSKIS